jgi:hypothetical protein
MSYFADLTPHTYTSTDGQTVLNVGWLDAAHPFESGETSVKFRDALRKLCEHRMGLHRGFHECQFCPPEEPPLNPTRIGNGQIRVMALDGSWYAAPTMIHHYVTAHRYLPPQEFIDAVLKPVAVAIDVERYR